MAKKLDQSKRGQIIEVPGKTGQKIKFPCGRPGAATKKRRNREMGKPREKLSIGGKP
jgi:hypothetical protein